ncbi:MAG TPA: hypothetical protein PLB73_11650, partial [Leptospiraceae bacterium]|nr:hypothetical protein [Leptospiraceae bacterium]
STHSPTAPMNADAFGLYFDPSAGSFLLPGERPFALAAIHFRTDSRTPYELFDLERHGNPEGKETGVSEIR